jgi:hypothetical protein
VSVPGHASVRAATGELVLATLYLAPSEERDRALAAAAAASALDWDAALVALEAHGVLGLARRNLERAGARLPERAHLHLRARAEVMRALEVGFRLTLERFLAAAARRGIEMTLLKGAALAQDLYPPGGLRMQGDLDLLVAPGDVPGALAAAREIGLDLPPRAFPAWWHRLAHFHLKLVPADPLQRELELHWHLHPEAALHTVRLEDLCARRRPLMLAGPAGPAGTLAGTLTGVRAWTLDPLDRLLHLATHLARHAPHALDAAAAGLHAPHAPATGRDRAALAEVATEPTHPLRLKWLLDVHAVIEASHGALDADALGARASEWSAARELALVLAAADALGFAPDAAEWVARVRAGLQIRAEAPLARARPSARPLPGLDVRASALAAFPRWVFPPRAHLARTGGDSLPARFAHATRVLARATLVALATPPAWLASRLRRRARRAGPDAVLELAAAARRLTRARDVPPGS